MVGKLNPSRKAVVGALIASEGNARLAAHLLDIDFQRLYKVCVKLKIRIKDYA